MSVEQSASRADTRCKASCESTLRSTVTGYTTCTPETQTVRIRRGQVQYALLPVWMLHTKWKGKDYLFSMNGQTGKLTGDLPVSWGRFWAYFAGIAGGLAAVLAVRRGKRVVIEHFDLIYPLLGANANLLIGVGEEIIITRPTIFGPEPQEVYQRAYDSLPYRLMAHTAEDLCECFLPPKELERCSHDDVHHGFILAFPDTAPELDLDQLEQQVADVIARNVPVDYVDESHIRIDHVIHECTGPRTHVRSTGKVQGFRLLKHFVFDPYTRRYLLVGCVGEDSETYMQRLDRL